MQAARMDWRPSLVLMAFTLALLSLRLPEVLGGVLPGNDDMMRLQQVRDLIAGQAWFDVDQARLITPEGGAMHWSRLPDLALAAMIIALAPLLGQAHAEAVAVFVWPVGLLMATMAGLALVMRRLGAETASVVLALFFFISSKSVYQFWPGRIDHHGLEIAFVVFALAALLAPKAGWRSGAVAGASVAAMVGVAIESLPYAGALTAGAALFWVLRGEAEARRLRGFGLAAAGMAALLYVFDAPGIDPARVACDAFGSFHAVGLGIGGLLLAALSFGPPTFSRLGPLVTRTVYAGGAGALTLGIAVGVAPGCLSSPYATVSEAAVTTWMSRVGEARSIDLVLAQSPAMAIGDIGFVVAGLMAAAYLLWRAPVGRKAGFVLTATLLVLAAAVSLWQIRGVLFAHILAAIPAGYLAGLAFARWRDVRGPGALLIFAAVALALAPPVWRSGAGLLAPPKPVDPALMVDGRAPADYCRDPDAYGLLAALPRGKVFSPIDLGTSVLLRTPHAIYAAPYHRNSAGIAQVTAIFQSPPEQAKLALAELGADYFVTCRGLAELKRYGEAAPGSMGDMLSEDRLPAWLEAVDGLASSERGVRVFRIRAEQPDRSA